MNNLEIELEKIAKKEICPFKKESEMNFLEKLILNEIMKIIPKFDLKNAHRGQVIKIETDYFSIFFNPISKHFECNINGMKQDYLFSLLLYLKTKYQINKSGLDIIYDQGY